MSVHSLFTSCRLDIAILILLWEFRLNANVIFLAEENRSGAATRMTEGLP